MREIFLKQSVLVWEKTDDSSDIGTAPGSSHPGMPCAGCGHTRSESRLVIFKDKLNEIKSLCFECRPKFSGKYNLWSGKIQKRTVWEAE